MVQRSGTVFDNASPLDKERRRPRIVPDPLSSLMTQSDNPLYTVQTVFPFVLFPDKMIIRVNHVDFVKGIFFGSAASTRVQIPDVRQVSVEFNPFFATLELIPQGPLEQMMRIGFLWKDQAKKARRIIAGLVESHQKNVDLSRYSQVELLTAMETLGKASEV